MDINDVDFEGTANVTSPSSTDNNPAHQDDKTNLNGGGNDDITGKDNTNPDSAETQDNNNGGDNNDGADKNDDNTIPSTGELTEGTIIEFDGVDYKVDKDGNLVDKDGQVFKEAKDVEAWLKENEVKEDDGNQDLTIDSIREVVGIDVTDDEGKPVEFTNDPQGVKSYIESVISLKSNEIQQGAVNKLFNDNPLLKQFIDYVQVTGTPRGFGDIPDRSGIKLDKDNVAQQEAIIRLAAEEFGNKSINDNYIKYLKDSGGLYDVAKEQLEALVGKDKAYRKEVEEEAARRRAQQEKEINDYWKGVADVINKRTLNGYKIPDSFVKEINGKKITLTPDDFYKYVASATVDDGEGSVMTPYQRDLNNLSQEEALNKELLDAWLMFTGGSYKDLIAMADKEDKVRKLVIKSKEQRNARTIKIHKPNKSKFNPDDIVLS